MKDIALAKNLLNDEKKAIVIVKDGEVIFSSKDKGIKPVCAALNEFKDELQGSSVADKVIGKAAAMIYKHADIKELSTKLISERAVDVLKNTSIVYDYEKLVPYIKNRDQSGLCPIETLSLQTDNIDELLLKISNFLEKERTREKFALLKQENSVHGSDSKESAEREIKIWFE